MLKPFCWEIYDGSPMIVCGPFYRARPVLLACKDRNVGQVLLYDPFSKERTYEEVLERYQRELQKYQDRYPKEVWETICEEIRILTVLSVKKVSREELPHDTKCFPILVGKAGVKDYLRALGVSELSDLYFATPILKNGFDKCDYYSYFSSFFRKQRDALYLGHVELVLTSRCNLKCRYCANLMQYYQNPRDISRDILISSLQNFLDAVDGIGMVRLLGGEPLLAQENLRSVLEVFEQPENQKVMGLQIVTNGTRLFDEKTLQMVKENPLITVYISNYDFLQAGTKALVKQLDSCGIPFVLSNDAWWQDYGEPDEKYNTEEQSRKRFAACTLKESCNTILDGYFYSCPRQAHGTVLGFYPQASDERVSLLNPDVKMRRKQIYDMHFRTEPVAACTACKEGSREWIKRAEQS